MVASTQYKLSAADLETVLALVRFGTLADVRQLEDVDFVMKAGKVVRRD